MFVLDGVSKRYCRDGVEIFALSAVSLAFGRGEFCAITGPSGAGKTSLMNILGLLDRPSSGRVLIDHKPVNPDRIDDLALLRNQCIGFVFQAFHLLPGLTALDNVALPLRYRRLDRATAQSRALAQLTLVGLADRARHRPDQLSGGQCQRVAIARALVGGPALLLADEPTGALDPATADDIMALLQACNRDYGVTVVIVTHDAAIAARCARQITVEDGRVVGDTGDETPSGFPRT